MNIVVTGANGFLGAALVQRLKADGNTLFCLVKEGEEVREELSGTTVVRCNLEDESCSERIAAQIPHGCDVLYHLAWIGVQPKARSDMGMQLRNITVLDTVMHFADRAGVRLVVLPGSTNEYLYSGGFINGRSLPSPRDAYGAAKVAVRYIAQQLARDYGIAFIYAVIASVYSEKRRDGNVISYTAETLLRGGRPSLTRCEQRWDYVHIDDVTEALALIGQRGKDGAFYAVGHGDNWPLANYIRIVRDNINPGLPLGLGEVPYQFSELPMSCVDLTDLTRDTGFVPRVSFEEGISRVISEMR